MNEEHYRWNVDPVWENLSSAFEEAYRAIEAHNNFMRFNHIRSLLYFASVGFEAFFNKLMRKKMSDQGESERAIIEKLKSVGLGRKINQWPSELCLLPVDIEPDISNLFDLFQDYHNLRHSLTHPKDIDHSIYLKLECIDPTQVIRAVQETLLRVHEAVQQAYPYWLLGWNFVGFNRDEAHPFLSNAAQFRHSLARMGLIDPADAWYCERAERWQQEWMADRQGFARLTSLLNGYPDDIEPWSEIIPGLGSPPRLCRRWWDHDYIMSTVPTRK